MADEIIIETTSTEVVEIGTPGPQGASGQGVPVGGTTGQVLRKASSTNYDTEWAAAASGSGSVTSVALAGTGLSISGSPITTSGTITANVSYGTTAGTATQGNDSRIANIRSGSIDTRTNIGGAGGSINLSGSTQDDDGNNSGNGGSINLSGGAADGGTGGSISSVGGNGGGGSITLNGGNIGVGGSINLSASTGVGGSITSTGSSGESGGSLIMSANIFGGGSINTSGGANAAGGDIATYDGGGSINTRGTGSIELGVSGTRTTLTGTATAARAISLPNASGTLALSGAAGTFTTLTATPAAGSTALTLTGGTVTASAPLISATQTWNNAAVVFTGLDFTITDTASANGSRAFDIKSGATSIFSLRKVNGAPLSEVVAINGSGRGLIIGSFGASAPTSDAFFSLRWQQNIAGLARDAIFTWGTDVYNNTYDLAIQRDAADTLAQRRSTNAQTFRLYSTYTSATSFERLNLIAQTGGSFIIGTEKGSAGGTARGLELRTDNTARLTIGSGGGFTLADAQDIAVGTTTGTKIGTATTQKIGFWNATPVVQQSGTGTNATGFTANGPGNTVHADSTFTGNVGATAYTISDIVKHLKTIGLIAS